MTYLFYKKAIKEQAYMSSNTTISFEICMSSFMHRKATFLFKHYTINETDAQCTPTAWSHQYLWIVLVLYELLSENLAPEVWNPFSL